MVTEEIRPICLYIETCLHKKEGTRDCNKCEHHLNYWTEVTMQDMEKNIERLKQENNNIKKRNEEWAKETIKQAGQIAGLEFNIERLKQENEKLLEARNHFMAVNLKYFTALEEIKELNKHCADCEGNTCGVCAVADGKPNNSYRIANEALK